MEAQTDLSMITLFLRADIVVKAVMIALMCASVWSWAIIFEKIRRLTSLNRDAREFEEQFWSGGPLDDLYERIGKNAQDPMSAIFIAAMREWRRSIERTRTEAASLKTSLAQRIERVMKITSERELGRIEARMGFLASTGSVSPFVGLFGTVWGIMNSFHSIGMSKNTSLAVVAPGIAEALFATALGLVAAIPAVIAYNKLSSDIDRYAKRLDIFSSEFSAIVSRQLDERR
jgi:biopolymer transport protein TolQ